MKIGIVTQPLMGNYGGLLQNYALQQVLIELGHTPITLDQKSWHLEGWKKFLQTSKAIIYNLLFGKKKLTYNQHEKLINETLRYSHEFVRKYIYSTQKVSKDQELKCLCLKEELDAIIVGSDQVWRPLYAPHIEQSYLSFVEGMQIKRIAYAASFGVDEWEYTPEQTRQCRRLIKQFDSISVRENSGISLCKEFLGVEAEHVLDPTMLLPTSNYCDIVNKGNTKAPQGELFAYILDNNEEKKKQINNIARLTTLKPFFVNQAKELKFDIPCNIEEYTYPPVEQWLRSFRDAKYVVCDSFHGMVFSVIFNKNFIVLANKKRGSSRFASLLKMLGLEDRLIGNDGVDNMIDVLTKPIEWDSVNEILNSRRVMSKKFLQRSLAK